jgi:hypothetical protein
VPEHYETIQAAMDAAAAGDTVVVAPGTYTDRNEVEIIEDFTVEAVVIMKPGVSLIGDPDAPESVVIQATDDIQGIFCQDADSTTTVAGLTVTGGRSGFLGRLASPVIHHCRFVDNQSPVEYNSGGGMYGDFFSPTISDCLFSGNWASSGGGATFANESFPVLQRCTFTGNEARTTPNGSGRGGALTVVQASGALLVDCTVTDNLAGEEGGGFWISDSEVRLERVTVTGNECEAQGGAFYLEYGADLQLLDASVTGNMAGEEGGGVFARAAAVAVAEDTQLRQNAAPAGADGFLLDDWQQPTVTLICCDADPDAWEGDGLVIDDSDCD